ncbi:hypothetical protein MSPP1_002480 [Malassezia sp. CBS 17886]|nr:hypothetical protein MSPP1_002480 [Malassezia sp. CBS 17886]
MQVSPGRSPTPRFAPKRKLSDEAHDDEVPLLDAAAAPEVFEHCSRAVVARTSAQQGGANAQAEFYPVPAELSRAVLTSLGVGSSRGTGDGTADAHMHTDSFRAGLLQPATGAAGGQVCAAEQHADDMPLDTTAAHGPQCKSLPQLSVRYHGGTASELWALCPDCGAFSKVHEDQPVLLSYSP